MLVNIQGLICVAGIFVIWQEFALSFISAIPEYMTTPIAKKQGGR